MLRDGFGGGEVWLSGFGESSIVISCDAGIVDKQMDPLWLFARQFLCQALDVVFAGYVAWKCNDLARSRIVLLHHLVQGLLATSCNVDFGTVGDEGLGDHEADTGSPAWDYGRKIGYVEKFGGLELVI